ncbi:MAG TPA: helix-turn-helix domain-containing protein [Acidimicrobiales bacterium]|jgi:transcriptional regulator with XRE-family HTH domain|nr:helix-turn-helix domain-containing protein [Acidimicrobiales bacterium]
MRGSKAGNLWYLDWSLAKLGHSFPAPPLRGWVRTIREGLGLSGAELGVRLGVSQPRISQIERAELDGTLQLGTLERVAAALHCQLRYAFIPNEPLEGLAQELTLLKEYGWRETGAPATADTEGLNRRPIERDRQGPKPARGYSTE